MVAHLPGVVGGCAQGFSTGHDAMDPAAAGCRKPETHGARPEEQVLCEQDVKRFLVFLSSQTLAERQTVRVGSCCLTPCRCGGRGGKGEAILKKRVPPHQIPKIEIPRGALTSKAAEWPREFSQIRNKCDHATQEWFRNGNVRGGHGILHNGVQVIHRERFHLDAGEAVHEGPREALAPTPLTQGVLRRKDLETRRAREFPA